MSEDLAFRIQLGIILPKLKEKVAADINEIFEELVNLLQQGTLEGEEIDLAPIKEIFIKDFEIFLDDSILPGIEEKIHPPVEEAEESGDEGDKEEEAEEEAKAE